ncbi:MAG: extracellular solute-binding protein [Anaerolineaceae bacterium]|nr:MAG: extracellular solute-binding protein [Anaerolineaceae bacterium]
MKYHSKLVSLMLVMVMAFGGFAIQAQEEGVTLNLSRFFGVCDDEYGGFTDIEAASGECGIVTTLINNFNATNDAGITVVVQGTEWGAYYDQLNATFAGGNAPDIAVMHRTRLIDYTSRNLVIPVGEAFEMAGIDVTDFPQPALDAVSVDGEVFGLPFDLHTLLWHVNADIMAEAGLVDEDGTPIMPGSPEELLEHAAMVQEATGMDYIAMDATQFPLGVRAVFAMIWQQGGDLLNEDRTAADINNEVGLNALNTMNSLFEGGFANATYDYASSQEAFINGETAILINGTWVVDFYTEQAEDESATLTNYVVSDFPTLFDQPATWSDTHMWAVTNAVQDDPAKLEAAMTFLSFINDNNIHWARTGHVAVRNSVLESEEYQSLPRRDEYVGTADIAFAFPQVLRYQTMEDILAEEFQAVWLTGKSPEDALASAESRINDILVVR